jgi:hypothetical protein
MTYEPQPPEDSLWEHEMADEPEQPELGPGERLIDGKVMYSAAWLNEEEE